MRMPVQSDTRADRSARVLTAGLLAMSLAAAGCAAAPPAVDTTVAGPRSAAVDRYDPSRALGRLFHDVQLARTFPDSKTFVDA
ncbi:MAG: hypothetical protein ACREK1_14090, partial [Longimicrobiales bacterium]